jgi:hypothetical protein
VTLCDYFLHLTSIRLSRFLPDDFSSRLSIYFKSVNRLRTKTSDLFKAVFENNYDVIVLLETSLVSSFHDEELFDSKGILFLGLKAIAAFKRTTRSPAGGS